MSIRAIYKDGVFKPLEDVSVQEGTEVDVYPREERANGKKPKSVFDLEFFGMWKNRDDIGTGVEYVNRIRKYRREPEGQ
jgi:predicted DNA-binding antitoxin AbrB/MazE fold protein